MSALLCCSFTREELVAVQTLVEQLIAFLEWEEKYSCDLRWDAWAVAREYNATAPTRRAENRKRVSRISSLREKQAAAA